MRQIGKGFSAAYKLCATLNMPALSKAPYVAHENRLLRVFAEVADKCMGNAASEIAQKIENVPDKPIECGVSVDGTWQRRGYTSMNGCVTAISIHTGKVVDVEVLSSYCPKCKIIEKMLQNIVYDSLKADHVCQCNYEGLSAKMETVGASHIFLRSIKKRKLKYTE